MVSRRIPLGESCRPYCFRIPAACPFSTEGWDVLGTADSSSFLRLLIEATTTYRIDFKPSDLFHGHQLHRHLRPLLIKNFGKLGHTSTQDVLQLVWSNSTHWLSNPTIVSVMRGVPTLRNANDLWQAFQKVVARRLKPR